MLWPRVTYINFAVVFWCGLCINVWWYVLWSGADSAGFSVPVKCNRISWSAKVGKRPMLMLVFSLDLGIIIELEEQQVQLNDKSL